MEIDVLVDTSLLIARTRQATGISQLAQTIESYKFLSPAVSIVTKFEYEFGELKVGRKGNFEATFPEFMVIATDESIWKRASYLQIFSVEANAKMELADLLIASTAIYEKVPLLTLNFTHFAHLQANPYRLRLPKVI